MNVARYVSAGLAASFSALAVSGALAQSSTNVATVAVDAFGEKVGSEQIGLYNEQQVRGFSLQESGNYRIDGAYFIRSANIVDPALDGVTIRVGINALGVDFPAPSGIVEYRMPTPAPGAREQVEFAYRDYGGWAVLSRGSAASSDGRIGASYGINVINDTGSDGVPRRPRHFALVPVWRPNDALQVKLLLSVDRFTKQGDYQVTTNGTVLPPKQVHPGVYAADWTRMEQWQYAGGAVVGYAPNDTLALQSSFVVTDLDRSRGDFTLLTLGADGTGTANAVRSRPNQARSAAAETKASVRTADNQRLFATLRWRSSKSQVRPGVSVPFAFVDQKLGVPVTPLPPEPPEVDPNVDFTRQFMGGIGYEADVTDSLWLRGAVLKTHYRKEVRPAGAAPQTSTSTPWLYDLAATYSPADNLTMFATTVRGLEESGTAPNNAANRNEVLPAVMATQYELGLRYRLNGGITFIGSLFEISKPTPGLDTTNVYRLIGQARHRGIEISLTGKPAPGFNVVGGLALLEPARLGELVDKGLIRNRAAGIPTVTGLLNLTYQLPFMDRLSLDSQINYTSNRLLNPRTGLNTPAYATIDIGARYVFKLGSSAATLRARIGNLFDVDQWMAMRSETMTRVQRRAFRLSLTTNFDHPGLFD